MKKIAASISLDASRFISGVNAAKDTLNSFNEKLKGLSGLKFQETTQKNVKDEIDKLTLALTKAKEKRDLLLAGTPNNEVSKEIAIANKDIATMISRIDTARAHLNEFNKIASASFKRFTGVDRSNTKLHPNLETQRAAEIASAKSVLGIGPSKKDNAVNEALEVLKANGANNKELAKARATVASMASESDKFRQNMLLAYIKGQLFYSVFRGTADSLRFMIGSGIELNKFLETAKLGMTGVLASVAQIGGKTLSIGDAAIIAAGSVSRLNQEAMKTSATATELNASFRSMIGLGISSGLSIKQIEKLTVVGSNAVKVMGINSQQIVQELRDLLDGTITTANSQVATSLGLTKTVLANARKSAKEYYDFLMKSMVGLQAASHLYTKTFEGSFDQLRKGLTLASAEGFKPFYDYIKYVMQNITDKILILNKKTGDLEVNPDLVASLKRVANSFITIIDLVGRLFSALNYLWPMIKIVGAGLSGFAIVKSVGAIYGWIVGVEGLRKVLIALQGGLFATKLGITGLVVGLITGAYAWYTYATGANEAKSKLEAVDTKIKYLRGEKASDVTGDNNANDIIVLLAEKDRLKGELEKEQAFIAKSLGRSSEGYTNQRATNIKHEMKDVQGKIDQLTTPNSIGTILYAGLLARYEKLKLPNADDLAGFSLAQARQETGNFTKPHPNNYFGTSDNGKVLSFNSLDEGLDSYFKNLTKHQPDVFKAKTIEEFTSTLVKGNYNVEDKKYAERVNNLYHSKLTSVAAENKMAEFDSKHRDNVLDQAKEKWSELRRSTFATLDDDDPKLKKAENLYKAQTINTRLRELEDQRLAILTDNLEQQKANIDHFESKTEASYNKGFITLEKRFEVKNAAIDAKLNIDIQRNNAQKTAISNVPEVEGTDAYGTQQHKIELLNIELANVKKEAIREKELLSIEKSSALTSRKNELLAFTSIKPSFSSLTRKQEQARDTFLYQNRELASSSPGVVNKEAEYKGYEAYVSGVEELYSRLSQTIEAYGSKLSVDVSKGTLSQLDSERMLNLETKRLSDSFNSELAPAIDLIKNKLSDSPELMSRLSAIMNDVTIKSSESYNKLNTDWVQSSKKGFDDYRLQVSDVNKTIADTTKGTLEGIEDALVKWAQTGKLTFEDLGNYITGMMLKISAQAAVSFAVNPGSGGLLDMVQNYIFGGGGGGGGGGGTQTLPGMKMTGSGDLLMASGGLVDGPGTETSDSIFTRLQKGSFVMRANAVKNLGIPVRLSKGEYVFSPKSVNRIGAGLLRDINRSAGYAKGGLVGGGSVFSKSPSPTLTMKQDISIDARGSDVGVEAKILAAMRRTKDETINAIRNEFVRHGPLSTLASRA